MNGAPGIVDPVCGMTVTQGSPHRVHHDGREFFFCSEGCRKKFVADPQRYLSATGAQGSTHQVRGEPRSRHEHHIHTRDAHDGRPHSGHVHATSTPSAPADKTADTIYTCPMHPQIRQRGPGSCPICGMALEPLVPTGAEDDSELRSVRKKFWIAAALTIPVVVIAMLPHLMKLHLSAVMAEVLRYTELLFTLPVVLWAGASYYRRGWQGVLNRSPNMYTLIGLGVAVVYAFSLFATSMPTRFPPRCARPAG